MVQWWMRKCDFLLCSRYASVWRWARWSLKAILKNRTFAFVSGRLREFYSGSRASIHARNPHNLSKDVVHFVVVSWNGDDHENAKRTGREFKILINIWAKKFMEIAGKLTWRSTPHNPISNASWRALIHPWVPAKRKPKCYNVRSAKNSRAFYLRIVWRINH